MTNLQQAAQALINRWNSQAWKDQPHTAEFVEQLRKALNDELAQSVEPYAVFQGLVDSGEHGAFNLDLLKMIPRGAYLYLHPPQPQATTPSIRQHCRECANWAKAVADTKEWADGVKIGREIIKKLASTQGEVK